MVKSLEDLCIDKVFLVGCELLSKNLVTEFEIFIKEKSFAERLSQKLIKKILLHDCNVLTYFSTLLSSLSNITLDSTKFENYEFLRQFNLALFSSKSLKSIEIDDFLKNFNEKSKKKMRYLRLNKIMINRGSLLLPQFINIKFLDLSYTNLSSHLLHKICTSLRALVGLNVANTKVNDLSSLRYIENRLELLDIHDLFPKAHTHIFEIIYNMDNLRHLDLGVTKHTKTNLGLVNTIESCRCFSSLHLLDLSGHQGNIDNQLIIAILHQSSNLKYLILNTHDYWYSSNDDYKLKRYIKRRPELIVVGAFSKQTMLNSLKYSLENPRYLSISLKQLFNKTYLKTFVSDDLNQTLLEHMSRIKPKNFECLIMMTAVVYNLTKGQLTKNWNPDHLSAIVNFLSNLLKVSDISEQLAVNIFLILCNDFIIQKTTYEKVKLAQLIFKTMSKFESVTIHQNGVIIISIIASELSKTELNVLVSDISNFRNLLILVCRRCVFLSDFVNFPEDSYLANVRSSIRISGEPIFDYTLKFTLSCLWNLTDECSLACQQFVEQQGLLIYFIMIERFKETLPDIYSHICNKCLGLLNNIAEEKTCRSALLTQHYMDFLIEMLEQDDIQMTYFAGGILSNLLLLSNDKWSGKVRNDKAFYEIRTYVAVVSWVSPDYLMASYRSFYPFANLIVNAGSSRAILIWALWAIRHTMKIERSRYRAILAQHREVIEKIELLEQNHDPEYGRIRTIAADILLLFKEDNVDNDTIYQMMIE